MTEFPSLCPWKLIQKFSEIDIKPNTLVLCDIDDTLLHHPFLNNQWCNALIKFFIDKRHAKTHLYDPVAGEKDAEEYFENLLKERLMQHTDRDGFFEQSAKAKKWMFITARTPETIEFTYENLRSIDVDPDLYEVRFSGYKNKGEYIQSELADMLTQYDYVVFIDDQPYNLENVNNCVSHPGLQLYKFDYQLNEPDNYYPFPDGFYM